MQPEAVAIIVCVKVGSTHQSNIAFCLYLPAVEQPQPRKPDKNAGVEHLFPQPAAPTKLVIADLKMGAAKEMNADSNN